MQKGLTVLAKAKRTQLGFRCKRAAKAKRTQGSGANGTIAVPAKAKRTQGSGANGTIGPPQLKQRSGAKGTNPI